MTDNPEATQALIIIDEISIIFFTLEYVVRFTCAPRKWKFFKDPMNLVDLLAIIPFYLTLVLDSMEDMQIIGKAGKLVRLVRVLRIMRIFKLVRHFAGLQSLIYTLNQAYQELGLLMLLVGVAVLTFASLVYFAEKDARYEMKLEKDPKVTCQYLFKGRMEAIGPSWTAFGGAS